MEERIISQQKVSPAEGTRLVGISVRAHSFGFVVIEGRLALDCGVRTCYRAQFDDCLGDRFARILRTYHPASVIILSARSDVAKLKTMSTRNAIKNAATRSKIPTVQIRSTTLHRHFAPYHAATKHEIAIVVAQIFPELAWRLPPKRKPWQNEHYSMSIFAAAAAVIVHAFRSV